MTVHVAYDMPPASLPRGDYQLVGDRIEAGRQYLLRFSPSQWDVSIMVNNGVPIGPEAAARDDVVSVSMFCGL